jgi:hypothetical protein
MAASVARLFMAGQAHSALGTAKIITGDIHQGVRTRAVRNHVLGGQNKNKDGELGQLCKMRFQIIPTGVSFDRHVPIGVIRWML